MTATSSLLWWEAMRRPGVEGVTITRIDFCRDGPAESRRRDSIKIQRSFALPFATNTSITDGAASNSQVSQAIAFGYSFPEKFIQRPFSVFGYALKIGAISENPLVNIEKPRIKRGRPAILDTKEFQALLKRAFGQSRFDVLNCLVLGGFVGLRPYEVLRLEWTGIQFQTSEIRIEPAWTKTHRARVIPLAANALVWLKLIAAHTPKKAGRVMPLRTPLTN